MRTLMLLAVVAIVGCSTPSSRLNKVSLGMNKAQVVEILGEPESTRASKGVEFLIYSLRERIARPGEAIAPIGIDGKYFVKFVEGKVESYGHVGDFDSTKPFESRHEVDVNVHEKP